jgi:hypothetical protein
MKDIITKLQENIDRLSANIKQINDLLVLENKILQARGLNDNITKEACNE